MLVHSLVLLLATAALAHRDFYAQDFHSFLPRELPPQWGREGAPTTVNIYKIYAPNQIFVSGADAKELQKVDFAPKDKQMSSGSMSILDRILRTENSLPDGGKDRYFMEQFQDSYDPRPSSVMSRKLPAFPSPSDFNSIFSQENARVFPLSAPREEVAFMPPFHLSSPQNDFDLGFIPDPLYEDYSDHPAEPDNRFPEYLDAPIFRPFKEPVFPLPKVSPLLSFFETIATSTQEEPSDFHGDLTATVTYGEPEMLTEAGDDEPQEVEVEEIIPEEALMEVAQAVVAAEDTDEDDVDVEINRSFVKTILPDNTSVTREVANTADEGEETQDEGEMDKIEVNVVKTILPDNSYTVSETITEEKRDSS